MKIRYCHVLITQQYKVVVTERLSSTTSYCIRSMFIHSTMEKTSSWADEKNKHAHIKRKKLNETGTGQAQKTKKEGKKNVFDQRWKSSMLKRKILNEKQHAFKCIRMYTQCSDAHFMPRRAFFSNHFGWQWITNDVWLTFGFYESAHIWNTSVAYSVQPFSLMKIRTIWGSYATPIYFYLLRKYKHAAALQSFCNRKIVNFQHKMWTYQMITGFSFSQ